MNQFLMLCQRLGRAEKKVALVAGDVGKVGVEVCLQVIEERASVRKGLRTLIAVEVLDLKMIGFHVTERD